MAEIKADLKQMKGISAKDQAMLAEAETLLGPDPDEMGFVQNMFWGRLREELVFPYPVSDADETARCDQLIAAARMSICGRSIPRFRSIRSRRFRSGFFGSCLILA